MIEKIRTFIAVDLPEEIKREIRKIQKQLPEFKGKLTEEKNLHLTLKFLGEIDEKKIEEIKRRLEEIKEIRFEAEIDSLGVFNEDFIKIIWLHLDGCEKLQKEVDEKLKDLFPKEKRFMSHLTIARVKNIKDKDSFLKKFSRIKINPLIFTVESFKLKKSVLTATKPIYEDLLEIKL